MPHEVPPERNPKSDRSPLRPGTLRDGLKLPEVLAKIADADIVLGCNAQNLKDETVFFGLSPAARIVKEFTLVPAKIVRVAIDYETDDAEALAEACVALKGSCRYLRDNGNQDDAPPFRESSLD